MDTSAVCLAHTVLRCSWVAMLSRQVKMYPELCGVAVLRLGLCSLPGRLLAISDAAVIVDALGLAVH